MPTTTDVQLNAQTHGLLVSPDDKPRGAILVLPMINGLSNQSQTFAGWVAEAGFAAMVWDPYPGQDVPDEGTLETFQPFARQLRDDRCVVQQKSLLGHMEQILPGTPLAVMGFCMGGRQALVLAADDPRLVACVAYHPTLRYPRPPHQQVDVLDVTPLIACPVQAIYPGQDHITIRECWERLRDSLETRQALTSTLVFPQAAHGFMESGKHDVRANFDATRFAWPQTVAFLNSCVDNPVAVQAVAGI